MVFNTKLLLVDTLQLRNEFEARFSKLESELCIERQRREVLEKELFEIKILLQQQRKL